MARRFGAPWRLPASTKSRETVRVRMPAWWLVALLLVPGCLQGSPDGGPTFQPTCPSWTQGTPGGGYSGRFTNSFADGAIGDHKNVGGGKQSYNVGGTNRPLDIIQIDFNWVGIPSAEGIRWQPHYVASVNGTMEGRIYREDTGAQVQFTRLEDGSNAPLQDVMRFPEGYTTNVTMVVRLAANNQPASPTSIQIAWLLVPTPGAGRADAAVDYLVTLWYRTC